MKALIAVLLAAVPAITDAKGNSYEPPTAEEMAPMRPEYLAELAKTHEPPEMAGKPMKVRNVVSSGVLKLEKVMKDVGSPEKATHDVYARINHGLTSAFSRLGGLLSESSADPSSA